MEAYRCFQVAAESFTAATPCLISERRERRVASSPCGIWLAWVASVLVKASMVQLVSLKSERVRIRSQPCPPQLPSLSLELSNQQPLPHALVSLQSPHTPTRSTLPVRAHLLQLQLRRSDSTSSSSHSPTATSSHTSALASRNRLNSSPVRTHLIQLSPARALTSCLLVVVNLLGATLPDRKLVKVRTEPAVLRIDEENRY